MYNRILFRVLQDCVETRQGMGKCESKIVPQYSATSDGSIKMEKIINNRASVYFLFVYQHNIRLTSRCNNSVKQLSTRRQVRIIITSDFFGGKISTALQ